LCGVHVDVELKMRGKNTIENNRSKIFEVQIFVADILCEEEGRKNKIIVHVKPRAKYMNNEFEVVVGDHVTP
jgi:hypothetical protein